jgi:hypothetical protein
VLPAQAVAKGAPAVLKKLLAQFIKELEKL